VVVYIPLRTSATIETLEDVTIENTQNTVRIHTNIGTVTAHSTHGPLYVEAEIGDVISHNAHGTYVALSYRCNDWLV
jgi:hypothetical protein